MSDAYVECLVEKKASPAGRFFTVLLWATAALCLLAAMAGIFWAAIPMLAAAAGAYFVNLNTRLEYEYLYLDKELTVDKVMAKSKRKRVGAYSLDRMEILAPVNSYHLDNYKNRAVKVKDYSIGQELQPDLRYAMYYEGGEKILLSPSPEMIKLMKSAAPRKVFSD